MAVDHNVQEEALLQPTPATPPRRCCSKACRCHAIIGTISVLLGLATGSVCTWALMHSLSSAGEGDVLEPCPGLCANAKPDGTFVANVSRSKSVLGRKIWVRFLVTHHFNSTSQTGTVHVDPYQSPFSLLQPFTCADVPVRVGSGCNLSFVSDCTRQADKRNDVVSWSYRWDGGDTLQVAESISTPFFKDRYVWTEQRANATVYVAPPAQAGTETGLPAAGRALRR